MPIYEYECPKCGIFEVTQKLSEKPLKAKPDCKDPKCPCAAQKIVSAPAFHLKGTGWYKSDYASSNANGTSKGSKNSAGSESTSEGAAATTDSSDSSTSSTAASTKKKGKLSTAGGGGCGSGCGCH